MYYLLMISLLYTAHTFCAHSKKSTTAAGHTSTLQKVKQQVSQAELTVALRNGIKRGNAEEIRQALHAGANPYYTLPDEHGEIRAGLIVDIPKSCVRSDVLDCFKRYLNKYDNQGRTFLAHALEMKMTDLAQALLKAGANANVTSPTYPNRPLEIASFLGQIAIVTTLIKNYRAQVNARGVNNMTALHQAAMAGQTAVVRLLVGSGADKSLKDTDHKTAYDYAQEFHPENEALVMILKCKR